MIVLREPKSIYQTDVLIQDGTFHGRWHFSFGPNSDRDHTRFGTLRVFNDDTLSPGAVWPLHPHQDIEVVTYCAGGEFMHADQGGKGGVLRKGHVQHTTVGSGMWHSEINNRKDEPMRFIQMWFYPSKEGLKPSVEQKPVEREDRTNRLLPVVSPVHREALPIQTDARVFASYLERGQSVDYRLEQNRGAYLYVLEGGPVKVNGKDVDAFGAAMIRDEAGISIKADENSELLLVDVPLL
ncbi:MAG: pirin family protein [Deltaproteobacteria bacterium]|nr:pirin family protein [Deltaproteobacteria bacterium]